MSEYFDISPPLSEDLAVFPGDQKFTQKVSLSINEGHNIDLSSLTTTVHCGAHADAPSHYVRGGITIEKRDLTFYYGPAQVVHLSASKGARLTLGDWGNRSVQAPRILVMTGSYPDPNRWQDDFNSFSPELIDFWATRGVRLVGIDTPSIDPASAKDLVSHQMVARHDLAILEGLVLKHVPEGVYNLIALPLRLVGFDASPVRAILLPL